MFTVDFDSQSTFFKGFVFSTTNEKLMHKQGS